MRKHGMVPLRDGVIGPFYRGFWGETIIRSGEVHDLKKTCLTKPGFLRPFRTKGIIDNEIE
jgi:hypothetical protein